MTAMLTSKSSAQAVKPPTLVPIRRSIEHMTTPVHTLLEPGHEAEWSRLNAEKRRALTPQPGTPVGELLRRGQNLSAQAAGLLAAVERGGGSSRA